MTDIEWGPEITIDRKMPEWLTINDDCWVQNGFDQWLEISKGKANPDWSWHVVKAFRLPASHAYYLATSKGFKYWPGGGGAPDDWDGGEVLWRDETIRPDDGDFIHVGDDYDIIGYKTRTKTIEAIAIAGEYAVALPNGTIITGPDLAHILACIAQ